MIFFLVLIVQSFSPNTGWGEDFKTAVIYTIEWYALTPTYPQTYAMHDAAWVPTLYSGGILWIMFKWSIMFIFQDIKCSVKQPNFYGPVMAKYI